MRTCFLLAAALMLAIPPVAASAQPWEYLLETELTMTQSYYSDNWTGGEVGNIAWRWNLGSMAQRQLTPSVHNRNTLRLKYGQTHNQDENDSNSWKRPQKSDDQIDFETIFRFTVWEALDPYVSGRFESQFYDASDPVKKRYVNPMRFTESAGISKALIEGEDRNLLVRLGGAWRQYLDRDALDPVSLERETRSQQDAGLMFDADARLPLAEGRIIYSSKLNVFQALYNSEKDDLAGLPGEDYWKSPDVRWENTFSANVTGHIVVSLYVDFRYDKEIDLKGSFKQTLALGINYRFGNVEPE
ncbi:MAG: DUF3078 domain-containing protein [Candidatus Krumholzibacteria bacterium]|nr:DUF3078 domain-containing protein [Candidatus Krumholzibacteria bacterium]